MNRMYAKQTLSILAALLFLSLAACSRQGESSSPDQSASTEENIELSMADFIAKYKADPKVNVLDVRTPGEYQEFHVKGAQNVSLQDIMEEGHAIESRIPFAKDQTIYVICRTGHRSFQATKMLRSLGYTRALSISGGTLAFRSAGNECGSQYLACAN